MNKYENDSFESSSSATSMSNESLSRNETEMYNQTEKENEKEICEKNAVVEEQKNTSDSNENNDTELVHHTAQNSPATSESDSLNEEHKWAALQADGRPEFKQLSAFVAFGSMSATSPLHSQRTSEYEQSYNKLEEELHEFEEKKHEQQEQKNEETDHENVNTSDKKMQNLLTSKNLLEISAVEVRKEHASQPRSDVEFSFLSTLEEHLETLGNKYGSANTNLPISHKEESNRVIGEGEIGDDKMSKTLKTVHEEQELEQSDVKHIEKETLLEQEGRNLSLENKLIQEKQEEEEEEEQKNFIAIKAQTRLQRENLSISPTANEHRHANLSKSVSFRLPSLPLPENLHTLEDSANVNDRNNDEEENYDNDIKEKTNKQILEQEQVRPLSLQTIKTTPERPEYSHEQIFNRQPYAVGQYNSHEDVLEQNNPLESTPSPLPSAKFNLNYANKHRAGNTEEIPLTKTIDNNVNKKERSNSHSRRHYHENENYVSKKLHVNFVNKDDERLLSKAKTIQETSLAVERLVQSLATLRGYNKLRLIATHAQQQSANAAPIISRESKYNSKVNVTADSAHGVCKFNKTNATGKIDSMVQETVLELVLRMLQQEKRTKETVHANQSLHYAKRRECHELVTAENFYDKPQYRWYNPNDKAVPTSNSNNYDNNNNTTESVEFNPSEQKHEPCSLSNNNCAVNLDSMESEYSKRFLHDHEALYKTIIDNVTKYIFKRVSVFAHNSQSSSGKNNIQEKKSSPVHDNFVDSSHVSLPTISPSFCTLLLIDLILLCKEIADTRLSTLQSLSSPLTNAYEPVLIKYCGQPYIEEVLVIGEPNIHVNKENNYTNNEDSKNKAKRVSKFSLERELVTTLVHCLPFEIVQSTLQVQEEEIWEQERLSMRCESALLRGRQSRESDDDKNNLIFRLEYWVGFEQMEVVINALLTCVRNLLSNCIQQSQYRTIDIHVDAIFDLRNNYDKCVGSSSPECVIDPPAQHHPYFVLMASKSKTSSSTFAREQADSARYDRVKNESQMTENVYRFPNYINPLPPTTNMCSSTNNTINKSKAQSIDINTFGLESIALQKLVLTVSKMTTEMMRTNGAKREEEQEQKRQQHSRKSHEENAKGISMLNHDMNAEDQYTLFSSCVMEVVTEHLKDVKTIATISECVNKKYVKRLHKIAEEKYSKDNHSKVVDRLRKMEKALIEKSEIEAANVLEQIRQEVNVFNASHKEEKNCTLQIKKEIDDAELEIIHSCANVENVDEHI